MQQAEIYEKSFQDKEENIKDFIEGEVNSFLAKLNEEREKKRKKKITIEQIKDDTQVTKENQILIDILNNFSTTLQNQNNQRGEKIEYIKKYCYKITIEAKKGIMFTSDTHAEADKVEKVWYFFDQLKKQEKIDKLVFLGDYGDGGKYWTYTYFLLAAMAEKYGEDILFIRGNHEDINNIMRYYSGHTAFYAIDENGEYTQKCWNKMPIICEITWDQKKIFCSHGAMPLNKNGEWETIKEKKSPEGPKFLENWNEIIFTEDPQQSIKQSFRGVGYEIPIKKIFENMKNKGYDYSVHGHVHKNQCGILTTEKQPKRVVTVVANEYNYEKNNETPFLPAVYIINNDNPNGTFFYLLQTNKR